MAKYTFIFILMIAWLDGLGQVIYPGSELVDYYKVLELKNTGIDERINIAPSILHGYNKDSLKWNPWNLDFSYASKKSYFKILPASIKTSYNSKYPRGYNDGAVWQGVGLNSSLQAGISGKQGILVYTFAPVVYFAQNKGYQLSPDRNLNFPYRYAYNGNIDYVQRFGEDPLLNFDWGQTDIRLVLNGFTLGVSTQNMVWGPAQVTPIIMGNQSAGIPHVDLGTYKPVETKIGSIEMKVYWGVLEESEYFDDDQDNNNRYWTGASVAYSPSFINGLYLGVNRAFYKRGSEFKGKDLFVSVWTFKSPDDEDTNPSTGNDEFDQMGSLMIRWSFDEVGFESYFELAKNDFGGGFTGLEPEHARAYTLGFIKLIDISDDKLIKLTYEHTSLDRAKTASYRNHNEWFTHSYVKQGYTHRGQIISGGIGPSSNTDHFGFQYYSPAGRFSATAQRIRFDDDYFYYNIQDKELHDMEWAGQLDYSRNYGQNRLNINFGIAYRQNMYYTLDNNVVNWSGGISWTHQF